jgi:hypothetical protein
MKEIEADQETRAEVLFEMEDGGPNGEAAVKNTAACDRAELCGGQEVGEEG